MLVNLKKGTDTEPGPTKKFSTLVNPDNPDPGPEESETEVTPAMKELFRLLLPNASDAGWPQKRGEWVEKLSTADGITYQVLNGWLKKNGMKPGAGKDKPAKIEQLLAKMENV